MNEYGASVNYFPTFGRLGAGTLVLGCLVVAPALMANSA